MVLLLGALSNFEAIQIGVKTKLTPPLETGALTRADLQEQTADLHGQLVARYRAGETVKALAREFGLHHGTVRGVLQDAGITIRTRRRLTTQQLEEAKRLYLAGQSTTEIGERFGCYASTIGRALLKLGVTLRPPGRAG
jgi:DNA invertase Pin-like site-specific DNA recombinase